MLTPLTLAAGRRLKICRIVTVPLTFQTLLREQLKTIARQGIDLTLVSSPGVELTSIAEEIGAKSMGIAMQRQPAPAADARSLVALVGFLRRNKFDIVHSSTPKAGLLAAIAGAVTRVPIRVHTFTGQPWVELTGLRRKIPRECDRLTAALSTQCYADSPSQRDFLVSEGLVARGKISVIGAGSISGVDLDKFSLAKWGGERRAKTRAELGIPEGAPLILFVGRVTRDKGIAELASAFELVSQRDPQAHLALVGPYEPERDPLPEETVRILNGNPRIHKIGFTATPEQYMGAADIFCLPSYREGFGSVAVEAGAMELPVVITRITGLIDAAVEGVTGLVVPPKDPGKLAESLEVLMKSPDLRRSLGRAGAHRVRNDFDARIINEAMVTQYRHLSDRAGVDLQ